MNRKDLIERVKKLLALSESKNGAEAHQAATRARTLIEKWNIETSEIEKGEVGVYSMPTGRRNFQAWERALITGIAEVHFCAVVQSFRVNVESDLFGKKARKVEACFEIVGREVNRIAVFELFAYLRDYARKAVKNFSGEYSEAKELMGFALGVVMQLHDRKHNWTDSEELSALIVTEDAANQEYIKQLYGEIRNARRNKIDTKDKGIQAGFVAGRKVNLDRQVRGSAAMLEARQ